MSTRRRPQARTLNARLVPWTVALLVVGLIASSAQSGSLEVAAAGPGLEALAVAPSVGAVSPPAPERRIHEGSITRGRTLSALLRGEGVSPQTIAAIAREMKGHFDFRHARPGHAYRLVEDSEGRIVEFSYRVSSTEAYNLVRTPAGYRVSREEEVLEARPARVAGVILTSLYQAITDLGGEGQLASDYADIFAWDIDFGREIQSGDSFQILYEKLYRTGGSQDTYVRPGRILAARFDGAAGSHTSVYYELEKGRGGYYGPDGSSVEGMFLKAPMRSAKMTSGYSPARRHPILKVTRPHRGIDYAAPAGTPVWAVAGGTVIHRGWAGGSGNLVKVRHENGYVSFYAHLSRFASDIKVGSRVGQKQVIGYVGSTGLATGPHVCFRIQENGKYVNPARLRSPAGEPIPAEFVPTFRAERDQLLAALDGRRVASNQP